MNLDHDFVQVSKLSEDSKKKMSSPKMEHFFPQIQVKIKKKVLHQKWNTFFPDFKWTPTLTCTPESNYWGGCRCRPYSNYWGRIQSNYWGDIPSPPGFGTPEYHHCQVLELRQGPTPEAKHFFSASV